MKKHNKILALVLLAIMVVVMNGCDNDTVVLSEQETLHSEPMTVIEDSKEDEMVNNIYINTISAEAKEKAKLAGISDKELKEMLELICEE